MLLDHQKLDFEDKCLIEKVVVTAPFRYSASFANEACFIHFSQGETLINSPSEQMKIEQGESLLLKCGNYFSDLIKYEGANRYEILVVHLYPDVIRKIYENEVPSFLRTSREKSFIKKISDNKAILKFIDGLSFYLENPALVNDDLLALKVKELILLLVQTKNAESVISLFTDLFSPRDQSVKTVVNSHLFSHLSIEDLAKLANMSLSTFSRTFHTLFNDTPANYIKAKRIERAEHLLTATTLTISEIANQTCFSDVAHFSRSFKEIHHRSPSAYRLAVKKS